MRVSENTAFNRAVNYVRRSKMKLEKNQEEVGSLKRINNPSDDPIGMVRLLNLRGEKNMLDELGKNIEMAKAFINVSDGALSQLGDILIRAKELSLQQAGDVGSTDITRRSVSEEVNQLYKQLVKISNSKLGGRYIFAGFKTDQAPFDIDGQYLGDTGEIKVEVAEENLMEINVPGNLIFKGSFRPDGNEGIDIFDTLNRLKVGLNTNNKLMVQGTIDDLDKCIEQNILYRARLGSRMNSLDRLHESHMKTDMSVQELISLTEDADVYKALSDLKKNENVLKTTLAASSKVIQPSLLDFLR